GSGSITISNAGELLTTGLNFSSGKAITLNVLGGTLATVTGAAATYSGVIGGSGPLTVGDATNAGEIILTAANNYSAGTKIIAGTLQLGNGGTSRSIIGDITNNGTLAFDRSDSVTFSGAISGTGGLVQSGSGTLTLSGQNTFQGATTVA